MKIHYFSAEPWEQAYVQGQLAGETVLFYDGSVQAHADVSDNEADALSIFIDSRIGEAELARFPRVKYIATRSTGFDHIDLAACSARGIAVATVPNYGEHTVAEFAFALLLALARKVGEARAHVRQTGTFTQDGFRGFDLSGKTLGVVGCGHIGVHAIRMGNGFGMRVLGFDAYPDEAFAREHRFAYVSLEDLLMQSDIVTLHVPYNPHTHHLLNTERFQKMKKGSYLINTARGAVVETAALVEALKDGTLAGAGLDVLEEEGEMNEQEELALLRVPHPSEAQLKTVLADRYLIDHPRVIVTPHIAFNTDEAVRRITDTTVENLRAAARGETIANAVAGA